MCLSRIPHSERSHEFLSQEFLFDDQILCNDLKYRAHVVNNMVSFSIINNRTLPNSFLKPTRVADQL